MNIHLNALLSVLIFMQILISILHVFASPVLGMCSKSKKKFTVWLQGVPQYFVHFDFEIVDLSENVCVYKKCCAFKLIRFGFVFWSFEDGRSLKINLKKVNHEIYQTKYCILEKQSFKTTFAPNLKKPLHASFFTNLFDITRFWIFMNI